MKIIYISSNLDQQIENVLNKISDIEILSVNEPIKNIKHQEVRQMYSEQKPVRIIIDVSCFYTDEIALEYLKLVSTLIEPSNIIVIYFNNEISYDLLKMGLYNLINFNRKVSLHDEMINLIQKPKKEIDEKMLEETGLNLKLPKIIAGVGFHNAVFQTSYWLTYLRCDDNKKKCLIEIRSDKQLEIFYEKNIKHYGNDIIGVKEDDYDIIFTSANLTESKLKKLLFSVSKEYDEIILDVSYNMLSLTPYIFTIANDIFIFRRECLFERTNTSLQEKTRLLLKDCRIKKVFESDAYKTIDVFYTIEDIIDFYMEEVNIDFMIFTKKQSKFGRLKTMLSSDMSLFSTKKKKSDDLLLS